MSRFSELKNIPSKRSSFFCIGTHTKNKQYIEEKIERKAIGKNFRAVSRPSALTFVDSSQKFILEISSGHIY